MSPRSLVEQLKTGLDAPICLTWELTYACNLACVHCLSSSGRRDPRELSTAEAKAVLDELQRLQVFYINMGGGEPMIRKDFFELVTYAVDHGIGVKFSTNGTYLDAAAAKRLTAMDYMDVQISLDGADALTNDPVRGAGSYDTARRAMDHLADAGFGPFKISVVVTRHNVDQLDDFKALADGYGAQLRVTRLRPSGRGADSWHELHPTNDQQYQIYRWLLAHGEDVLTGDSFFHLNALGESAARAEHVRCRARRVPDRPDRRRLRLPVRHPRRVQGRLGPRRRRLHVDLAGERAVPVAARAAVGRGLRQLRQLRRLPGRLHGGQVLHRPAPRRPRPGVRQRPRRGPPRRRRRRLDPPPDDGPLPQGRHLAPRSRSSAADPSSEVVRSSRAGRPGDARLCADACACSNRSRWVPARRPNRVLFGPHVTNLGDDDRGFTRRHTAYYERRARGGCGTIVVEGASVHESDWPYERAPLASRRRAGLGRHRRRLPAPRRARHRLARPRRRAGLVGLQPGPAVGAVAGARGGLARGAQVDGGRGHRRRHRRLRRRRRRAPSRPGATASRSTPASTAWCASSSPA